jgi:hypothetical protein
MKYVYRFPFFSWNEIETAQSRVVDVFTNSFPCRNRHLCDICEIDARCSHNLPSPSSSFQSAMPTYLPHSDSSFRIILSLGEEKIYASKRAPFCMIHFRVCPPCRPVNLALFTLVQVTFFASIGMR